MSWAAKPWKPKGGSESTSLTARFGGRGAAAGDPRGVGEGTGGGGEAFGHVDADYDHRPFAGFDAFEFALELGRAICGRQDAGLKSEFAGFEPGFDSFGAEPGGQRVFEDDGAGGGCVADVFGFDRVDVAGAGRSAGEEVVGRGMTDAFHSGPVEAEAEAAPVSPASSRAAAIRLGTARRRALIATSPLGGGSAALLVVSRLAVVPVGDAADLAVLLDAVAALGAGDVFFAFGADGCLFGGEPGMQGGRCPLRGRFRRPRRSAVGAAAGSRLLRGRRRRRAVVIRRRGRARWAVMEGDVAAGGADHGRRRRRGGRGRRRRG